MASYTVGTGGGGTSGNTATITVTTATALNDFLWVGAGSNALSNPVTGVTDTQGNTWVQVGTGSNTNAVPTSLWVCLCKHPLTLTGNGGGPDVITVTFTLTGTGSKNAICRGLPASYGVTSTTPEQTTNATGSNTNVRSGATSALAQPNELAIGIAGTASAGGLPTSPTFGTALDEHNSSYLTEIDEITTATTALNAGVTITSAVWASIIATFKLGVIPGVTANVATAAPAGSVIVSASVHGVTASLAEAAPAGSPKVSAAIPGATANVALAAPAGHAGVSAHGVTAALAIAAPAGHPSVSVSAHGVTANLTLAAPAGSVADSVSVTAPTPNLALTASPGSADVFEPVFTAATPLENNLLSAEDSDFEGGTIGTWAAETNASGLTVSEDNPLSGNSSLAWTSAGGVSQVHSGRYPVTALLPYIASGWLCVPAGNDVFLGIEWYNSSGTLLSTTWGPDITSTGAYGPVTVNGAAPATATTAAIAAQVADSNSGDLESLDLVYFAQSIAQVLIDFVNPPFQLGGIAGNAFMDVSPWVHMGTGITTGRGRQDSVSEIESGSATFTLQNDTGIFTRFNTGSIITSAGGDVKLQRRCQINLTDEQATWYTRFDGPISEIDYTFDNTGNTCEAAVTVADVLAYLNRQQPQLCWTREQVLSGQPILHYALDDAGNAGGAGVAAETSGNNGPPLRVFQSSTTASLAWQDTTGGVETLADASAPKMPDGAEYWQPGSQLPTSPVRGLDSGVTGPYTTPQESVLFTPQLTAGTTQNQWTSNTGMQLQAQIPVMAPDSGGSNYAVEVWFMPDPAIGTAATANYGPYIALSLGSSLQQSCIAAGIWLPGTFKVAAYSQPPAFVGKNWPGSSAPTPTANTSVSFTPDTVSRPHHLVINIQGGSTPGAIAWLDGVRMGRIALPAGQTFDTLCVGGVYGGGGCWYGNLSMCQVYDYNLSQSQIIGNCAMGQYGTWEQPTDDCIAALASFASIPPFWNNVQANHAGLTLADYQDITGGTPLSNMQLYEDMEMGLIFVNSAGQLGFHTRDWRAGYGAPDLIMPPDTFDAAMGYDLLDQFQINEQAVATNIFTTGASYVNQASQDDYGPYATDGVSQGVYGPIPDNSSGFNSPLSLPLICWSRAYAELGIPSYTYWTDPYLDDYCAWEANTHLDPWLMPGQLTIDLLTLDPEDGLAISDFYALEVDNMVGPGGPLPDSFPNIPLEWFVEGISETVSISGRTIQFYCTPATTQRAWIPGDPVYGALGSTARIGISAPDTSTPQADGKDVSHDSGGPYWAPDFTTTMNNPSGNGHSFIGANDIRGLTQNLMTALSPPILIAGTQSEVQALTTGPTTSPQLYWDTLYADTASGMGIAADWPNWYVVTQAGYYEIDASAVSTATTSSGGNVWQAWIAVVEEGAQALAASGTPPTSADAYVCPVGEQQRITTVGMNVVANPVQRMYLGLGDMVTLAVQQDTGSSLSTGTNFSGSFLSIRFIGLGTIDDRVQVNSSLASGGTVTNPSTATAGSSTFTNTHTYSYYGATAHDGRTAYGLRGTDTNVWQGCQPSANTGSQFAQVAFNVGAIRAALAGFAITGATLECSNEFTWYSTGATLMVGYFADAAGGSTWIPGNNAANMRDVTNESIPKASTRTLVIPVSIVEALLSNANGLMIGDDQSFGAAFYGYWNGGPGSWTLKVNWENP